MLEARLIALAVVAAILASALAYFAAHERSIGAVSVQSRWDAQRAADSAAALAEKQRQTRVTSDAANEAQRLTNLSLAAAGRVADARQRLHDYSAANSCAGAASAPSTGGDAASSPGDLHTRLLDGATEAAFELAAEADKRGIAGRACEAIAR